MQRRSETGRLIITAMVAGFLLFACSAPPSSPAGESPPTGTSAKPYGSLIAGWSQTIGTIDPVVTIAGAYGGFGVAVLDSLTSLRPDGNVTPALAERWEISSDGLTHTYYLRKGVKFHDGSDLTAADVKFSIDRTVAPEATRILSSLGLWYAIVSRTELKDDYTVVVHYKTPQFGLPPPIENFSGAVAIVPKKYIEERGVEYFRKNLVGSGPWKVVRYVPGERIELEADEHYWDTKLVPKFKNLTILTVTEEATRAAMLKTGELDIADVSPESAAALKAAGLRVKAWVGGQQANYSVLYDTKNPARYPVSDVRVRKAMSLAINRKEMADKLFGGYAEPGIVNRVLPYAEFFDGNVLKPDPYDPEGAKKLLAEAGYPNGFDTKIWDQGAGGILSTFSQALAGYWRRLGINATIEPIERATLVSMIRTYSDPRVWNTIYAAGIGTAATTSPVGFDMAGVFSTRTGFYKNHMNQRLDDLIDLYSQVKDAGERRRIARDASILARDEYATPSVLDVMTTWAVGSKIGDLTPIQGQQGIGASFATMTHAK